VTVDDELQYVVVVEEKGRRHRLSWFGVLTKEVNDEEEEEERGARMQDLGAAKPSATIRRLP